MTLLVHKSNLVSVRQHPQLSEKAMSLQAFLKAFLASFYLAYQRVVSPHQHTAAAPRINLVRV